MTRHILARRAILSLAALALLSIPARADVPPWPTPDASWLETDWEAFSDNLVLALGTDNDGLQVSALQMIIQYGNHLHVQAAAFDVVRMFQDHQDQRVRRLAAVACGRLKSGWAMGFLRMSEPFERDARVRATLRSLVRNEALLTKAY